MKKFITLGLVSKKLLYPVALAITLIIYNIVDKILSKNISGKKIYSFIAFLSQALGMLLVRLIPIIFKYPSDEKKDSRKDYFYLLIIAIFRFGMAFLLKLTDIGINFNIVNVLCLNEILDIIILLVLTRLFLSYKYYIHNVISLILFCVFGTIIDLFLGHYVNLKPVDSVFYLEGITKTVLACYMKIMMDTKFHKYWNIIFFMGIVYLISTLIIFIFYIIFNSNDDLSIEIKYFIPIFFINLIFAGFLQIFLMIVMVNVLTPNHIIMASEIGKIFVIIFNHLQSENGEYEFFFFLIPFLFQILSLLFYLEILECNFCFLNKNTQRNIQIREEKARKSINRAFHDINDVSDNDEVDTGIIELDALRLLDDH